jgi:hypothetical protein
VRSYLLGLLIVAGITLTVLSIRPGGLRRQLKLAARRLRIVLALGGVYLLGSVVIRIGFPTGPVADYAPPLLAIVLGVAFIVVGRDPPSERAASETRPRETAATSPSGPGDQPEEH